MSITNKKQVEREILRDNELQKLVSTTVFRAIIWEILLNLQLIHQILTWSPKPYKTKVSFHTENKKLPIKEMPSTVCQVSAIASFQTWVQMACNELHALLIALTLQGNRNTCTGEDLWSEG